MKKRYLIPVLLSIVNISFAQLTVTTNPLSAAANVCASNSLSITASAVPVNYTVSSLAGTAYDPFSFSGTVLVDHFGTYNGGTPINGSPDFGTLDDGRWDNITLPFSFVFYGNTFNSINISTNGWVGMGSTNSTATGLNTTIPNASAPNNVIHAMTTDLTFAGVSNAAVLQYFEVGTAPNRKFVIDYSAIKFFSGAATADVQIVLNETSNTIDIYTTSCTNTTANKAQGLENSTGTVAAVVTGRNNTPNWAVPLGGNAFHFTPDNITFSWSPATGLNTTTGATVIATPAVTTTYTVNALNTVNSATGSTTVTVTVNPASYTLAAVAGGPQICQNISVSPSGTNYRDGNCNLISTIVPTGGATAVSNSINTCIKIDTGATKRGTSTLYVARKYDIEPIINPYPATSTADVTLYYKQTEFNNYNLKASDSGYKLLPTAPGDATGISNLVLRQFHGTGTNPNNYTGPSEDFTTAISGFTVNWNSTRSWWEVKVPVTKFSGFYITSKPSVTLAISLNYFNAVLVDNKSLLSWKVNCTSEKVIFEIQRSSDGQHFTTIGNMTADQVRCSQPFDNTDEHPLSGLNYYRIKIIDPNTTFYYSNTISLMVKSKGFEIMNISPNPVASENAVLKINTGDKSTVTISIADFSGRIISNQTAQLLPGINQVVLKTQSLARGAYVVTTYAPGEIPKATKLVKQ